MIAVINSVAMTADEALILISTRKEACSTVGLRDLYKGSWMAELIRLDRQPALCTSGNGLGVKTLRTSSVRL